MKLGFTGTSKGMTADQLAAVAAWIVAPDEFHHGCCIGADEEAARIVSGLNCPRIVGHPPDNDAKLSQVSLGFNTENRDPLPYLVRNKRIVDACEVLLACPNAPEKLRSGTWSTVRYARKQGKKVVIVWPNGTVTDERP